MLIIGAGGLAKEILEIYHQNGKTEGLSFYDDINKLESKLMYGLFPILDNELDATYLFKKNKAFTLGIGKPILRYRMFRKFTHLGGVLESAISSLSIIGRHAVEIGPGVNILSGATISNSVKINKGCLIYYNTTIAHDCKIGSFVELSPGATLLGGVTVGSYTQIGSNATILPKIRIGENVVVGAGAVVTKDVPSNSLVVGVPAKVVKELPSIKL